MLENRDQKIDIPLEPGNAASGRRLVDEGQKTNRDGAGSRVDPPVGSQRRIEAGEFCNVLVKWNTPVPETEPRLARKVGDRIGIRQTAGYRKQDHRVSHFGSAAKHLKTPSKRNVAANRVKLDSINGAVWCWHYLVFGYRGVLHRVARKDNRHDLA